MIEVLESPPYCTVQDQGRFGRRDQAVPQAGAMDAESLAIGNLLVGNPIDAAGLEVALGPGRFRAVTDLVVAVTGGSCDVLVDGTAVRMWTALALRQGGELTLGVPGGGRFAYLCAAGGVSVPEVLGSRSTYLPGHFGGLDGRLLTGADLVPTGQRAASATVRIDESLPLEWRRDPTAPIRILEGPQRGLFSDDAWEALLASAYVVSATADRMGYRLDGPIPGHRAEAAIPSEPACHGALQVPAGSPPILLMPDGPTVGGYPKLAVVIAADLGVAGQLQPGDRPLFAPVGITGAHEALRAQRERLARIRAWIRESAG